MKIHLHVLTSIACLILINTHPFYAAKNEKPIVFIVAAYNVQQWYKNNLDSIFKQKYNNYTVIYTNDASTDDTAQLIQKYIDHNELHERITLINNEKNKGALSNIYDAIHMCSDESIIVIVDGDDWLASDDVCNQLNNAYSTNDIWLTYGQFEHYPTGQKGFCQPISEEIVKNNSFRKANCHPSHLRTFYAWLFKEIDKNDLLYNNAFLRVDTDLATMLPMIEMARDHFQFIPEVLYIYNTTNPISNYKITAKLQEQIFYQKRLCAKTPYDKAVWPEKLITNKREILT